MIKPICVSVLGLLIGGSCTPPAPETSWVPLKLDEQVTVQLPAQPQEMNAPDIMSALHPERGQDTQVKATRVYKLEDASAVYVVIQIPLAAPPTLPATFPLRKEYYLNRMIPLMLRQEYPNLLEQSVTEQAGVDMVTVKYKTLLPDSAWAIKYLRVLTVDKTVYQLHFLPLRQAGDFKEAERLRFFNSVEVRPPVTE